MTLKTLVEGRETKFVVITQDACYNAINAVGYESMVYPIDKVTKDPDTNKVLDFLHGVDKVSASDNHRKLVHKWGNT